MSGKRILLAHLASLGDCLMVTALARQVKHDFPGCHLTWAISTRCRHLLDNNPAVDAIWEIPDPTNPLRPFDGWHQLKKDAEEKRRKKEFDEIFYTQIFPDNLYRFDGTTRSSTFRGYPGNISVPVSPQVHLTEKEITHVATFADTHRLKSFQHVVLFESLASSSQSNMNPELALKTAHALINQFENLAVVMSSHIRLPAGSDRIIDASVLSYRENLGLASYCTFFVGCSSGITWLLTSENSKPLPMLQVLRNHQVGFRFASVKYDLQYWGLPSDHIIEVAENDPQKLCQIVSDCLENFESAKSRHHIIFKPSPWSYDKYITLEKLQGRFRNLLLSASYFRSRNKMSIPEILLIYVLILKSSLRYLFNISITAIKNFIKQLIKKNSDAPKSA